MQEEVEKDSELRKLIKRAQKGDSGAFEQLLNPRRKNMLYIALRYLKNPSDAEDCTQEAVIRAYRSIDQLDKAESIDAWLHSIIRYTCLDSRRKMVKEETRRVEVEAAFQVQETRVDFLPSDFIEGEENKELLLSLVGGLKPSYQEALLMFYFEGLSYSEISSILNINTKKVANTLDRARKALKQAVERETSTTFSFGVLPLGATPALTTLFQSDCDARISDQMVSRLGEQIHNITGVAAGVSSAAALQSGVSAAVGTSAAVGLSATAKAALALGSVALLAATGFAASTVLTPPSEGEIPEQTAPSIEAPVQSTEVPSAEEPVVEDAAEHEPINSAADMIGAENEAILLGYEAQGATFGQLQEFAALIGAGENGYANGQDGYEYYVWQLTKQDKELFILGRAAAGGEMMEVRHQFVEAGSGLDMFDFIFMFEEPQ